MQTLRAAFAANLAALCVAKGTSIAEICRQIGIQRAQMDRYLAGENLPNDATTARLCQYFGVEGIALFRLPGSASQAQAGANDKFKLLWEFYSPLLSPDSKPRVPEGYYSVVQIIAEEGIEQRLILEFRMIDDLLTFRAKAIRARAQAGHQSSGCHLDFRGLAVERFGWIYLAGFNRDGTGEPMVWSLQWRAVGGTPQLVGTGTLMTELGPRPAKAVVRGPASGMALRRLLRGVGEPMQGRFRSIS